MTIEEMKQAAAEAAADLVNDGSIVGLGSGSTAREFVKALGRRCNDGLSISAVASSVLTADLARSLGIPLTELTGPVDVAVDGADAVVSGNLDAIKGLGGALTRERIIAATAAEFILIVDETKVFDDLSDALAGIPIPVATVAFGWQTTAWRLARFGTPTLRLDEEGKPYSTDDGNYILDLRTSADQCLEELDTGIKALTGVVDHGLFRNLASQAIVGTSAGVRLLQVSSNQSG